MSTREERMAQRHQHQVVPMLTWNEKDLAWCPDLGLEGQILCIKDDRARIWWEDDETSWEDLDRLGPLPSEGAP